jgi:flagellar basal-body rod protein FlgB
MTGPDLIDRLFGIHAAALKVRSQRLDILASNIANAATPGYKARDLDFGAALVAADTGQAAPALKFRQPVQASLDGNTVELATEQTAFADNALRYRASLSFLSGRIQTMMSALKGGE